jgi:hypothetical protein
VVGIFRYEDAITRLVGAILLEHEVRAAETSRTALSGCTISSSAPLFAAALAEIALRLRHLFRGVVPNVPQLIDELALTVDVVLVCLAHSPLQRGITGKRIGEEHAVDQGEDGPHHANGKEQPRLDVSKACRRLQQTGQNGRNSWVTRSSISTSSFAVWSPEARGIKG